MVDRVALFQIDSVNVLARAAYLPLFSRLGPYDPQLLDRASGRAPRRLFEYWGHEASLLAVQLQPALRFRMASAAADAWGGIRRIAVEQPDLVKAVLAEIESRGQLTAREIQFDAGRRRDGWGWNWSLVKTACEWLFWSGEITSARRNGAFERVYDLPERVLPRTVLDTPTPTEADAHRTLVSTAAAALGVASEQCLRDYFRLRVAPARTAVQELVEAGELRPVTVEGWHRPAYLHETAPLPRRVDARALVGPFDSVVFERARAQALFGFRYRLEIYTPAEKRKHGYYVLPFLLGDRFVARVDLKADRAASVLRVQSAWAEAHAPSYTAEALAAELADLARWLGLDGIAVVSRGDLAPALAAAIG